jgi:predicted dehydrogenase
MSDASPGVAIIGCGLIGQKRAQALGPARLIACADAVPEKATVFAAKFPGVFAGSVQGALENPAVKIVIVATTHDALPSLAEKAALAGKHVLIEKPGARRAHELEAVKAAAKKTGVRVRVGFNHRYHPALRKAKELWDSGVLGEPMFLRARYGHGGRLGYENEWRAKPELSGGGELIDQGMHLIDLSRWFLGEFPTVEGFADTFFWNMPVDDNAFLTLRTDQGRTAFLHCSCSEWKNLFGLEIYGKTGKLEINGLGGSYGVERLTYYKMLPQMGPPETSQWEFPQPDESWGVEFAEFLEDIRLNRAPRPGIEDAQAALTIVERIYAK